MKHLIYAALLLAGIFNIASASLPVTERSFLYEDSLIWARFDSICSDISEQVKLQPEKEDSLWSIYDSVYDDALKANVVNAIKYASVPSGIKRVYMVRADIPKEKLANLMPTLPDSIVNSYYGQLVRKHIDTHQLVEGDSLVSFQCKLASGKDFDWNELAGKNVLLIFSGYQCMGERGHRMLKELYDSTSRDDFEIVHYWIEPNTPEELLTGATKSGFKFPIVSDFLKDATPFKIIYGCQGKPTLYFFDKSHKLIYSGLISRFPWSEMQKRLSSCDM